MSLTELEYRVFTATRAGINPAVPAGYESLAWVANSVTLVCGERDAVLVDTFFTLDQSAKLADRVAASANAAKREVSNASPDRGRGGMKQTQLARHTP